MQTKQLIFSLIAITAILFVSCSERQSATGTEVSGTQIFTFSLATEGDVQTRAAAPTVTGYKLQYFLQVLNADGNAIEASSDNNETGTFSVSYLRVWLIPVCFGRITFRMPAVKMSFLIQQTLRL